MRSDRERLLDIVEAIEKIEKHKPDSSLTFTDDEMLQIWSVHYLQIIGEAASRISLDLQKQYPEVPWGQIIGMRHILVHGYFDIDLEIVWTAVDISLPALKFQFQQILQSSTDL
jgi:uncharacterized protein with HEPN domain